MSEVDNKLYTLLGEMGSDIKHILSELCGQDARLDHHSQRITSLEKFQWKLVGMAIGASSLIGIIIKLL